jgi:putrescine---pyruvate transaminase
MLEPAHDEAWRKDRDHFIHPYTDYAVFKTDGSQVIESGGGVRVRGADGRHYLDAIAGLWCVNLGHGRHELADAMAEQAREVAYFNTFGHSTNVPAALLAGELAQLAPGSLQHVFYTTGGSTANDTAIRLIHYYFNRLGQPQKKKILSRNRAYHGSTYFAASLTGIHGSKYGFDRISEDVISHLSAADLYRRPDGMSEAQYCDYLVREFEDRIVQLGAENIAAFIAEPVMGAGGVLVAPRDYHRRMREVCRANNILYVADEVVTAFGRLGEWFASEARFGCVPDVLVIAKGMTSGYVPLGAAIFSSAIYDVISEPQRPGGVLSHGFTYSGHPVSCAVALKTIEIMKREDTLRHVRETGPYLQERARILARHEVVGDVRGDQFMLGIELVSDRTTKAGFAPKIGSANEVFKAARNRGAIVRPIGDTIVVSPPLIFSREDIDELVMILDDSIREVTPALMSR